MNETYVVNDAWMNDLQEIVDKQATHHMAKALELTFAQLQNISNDENTSVKWNKNKEILSFQCIFHDTNSMGVIGGSTKQELSPPPIVVLGNVTH